MRRGNSLYGPFTGQLGAAVDVDRVGDIALPIRPDLTRRIGRLSIEDEIGREMNQPDPEPFRLLREQRRRVGVDGRGEFRLLLGSVDRGVGRSIHNQLGLQRPDLPPDLIWIRQVEGTVRRCYHQISE